MYRLLFVLCLAISVSLSVAVPQRCGGGHSCVTSTAACKGGKCVCSAPYMWGRGDFNCYKKKQVACEIKMDPHLTTFSNETVHFPFPCRYLVTHLQTQMKNNDDEVIGNCEFKIYGFNGKHRGKIFAHGFDIATSINYQDGREVKFSSRHFGLARDDVYTFDQKGTSGKFSPNGPWGDDEIKYSDNGVELKVYKDDENYQVVYELLKCGLRVTLTPYDVIQRKNQIPVPGISIAINDEMQPQWMSKNDVMALTPWWQNGQRLADIKLEGLSNEPSMLYRAFTKFYEQNQVYPDDGQCHQTGQYLEMCSRDNLKEAFKNCYWMLTEPRFMRCIDKDWGGKDLNKLFGMCVNAWCNFGSCKDAKDFITDARCISSNFVPRIAALDSFLAGNMCP